LKAIPLKFGVRKDGKTSYYISSRPTFKGNASPTGQATRTFIVFDLEIQRVVFLKDAWRIDLPDMVKAGDTYEVLHGANVSFIAPFVWGDVLQHRTLAPEFIPKPWVKGAVKNLRPHHHYRMVLGVVGHDLMSFESSREMVGAIRDAFQGTLMNHIKPMTSSNGNVVAHKEAYANACVLHRDISVGDTLITNNGRGLLADWDLCKLIQDLATAARQSERTVRPFFLCNAVSIGLILRMVRGRGSLCLPCC